MSYDVLTSVPVGGATTQSTVTFSYPAGRTSNDYESTGAALSVNAGQFETRQSSKLFSLSYGDSSIRLFWKGPDVVAGKLWTLRVPLVRDAQVATDTARPPKIAQGPLFAIFGTSITDQCSRNIQPPSASPSRAWMADGYATWLRILTNQRINLPVENDFGVSGNKFSDMLARVNTVIAANADYVIIEGGSNDIPNLVTENDYITMRDTWRALVTAVRDSGSTPVIMPAPPRAGSVLTADQVKFQQRFYNYQREFCLKYPGFMFVDYLGTCLDQTSATSVPLSNMVKTDNLHPMNTLAYYMGKTAADLINPLLPPRPSHVLSNADIYAASINPTGNLLYSGATNYGLLAGTGGTQTSNANLTYAGGGSSAGSTFVRGTATSVCTVTLDKENPRTDTGRASGERQIIQIASAGSGGADEVYNFRFTPAIADVQAGDWYYGEVQIDVTAAPTNVSALELYLLETRPSNSQTAIDGAMNSASAGVLPAVTWSGVLRTPPIQRTSDATALQVNVRARLKADGGAAGITFKVGDFVTRKVNTDLI